MRRPIVLLVAVASMGAAVTLPAFGADTGNPAPQTNRVVSEDPAGFTPHVMDGQVISMTRVGNMIVVGGEFTTVRNQGSSTDIPRRNVFAFNAATGVISPTFAPNPNGTVYKVQAATDGSVYIGGAFTSITSGGAAVAVQRLYKADISTGARIPAFNAGAISGQVRDLSVAGGRLWVAGKFTHVQGQAQRALATLNATTGVKDSYFTGTFAGTHRPGVGSTNVVAITTDPANDRLVAIGNFATVNGATRHQLAVLDISGPSYSLANWYTTLFESPCAAAFETYMTDVEFSPNGAFFVVTTTGAYGGATATNAGTSGCDVAARFETAAAGLSIRPTWTAYTGGDTTWSAEVTQDVVYVGGHQRWQNNPTRGDAAGQGAVAREGIAALNVVNGLPYSWNPGRQRGVGVKDMIATEDGLFVGSDTNLIGGETHRRVAFLPLTGGTVLSDQPDLTLPSVIYRVASGQSQLLRRAFDGTQVTSSSNGPADPLWGTAVGAFMVNGTLYTAYANGSLTKRSFDQTTYGAASAVDTADAIVPQTDWHGTDVPSITSLFYYRGRIYFTRSNQNVLYSRGFETESDVVGQLRASTPAIAGLSYTTMRGAFVAGGRLYYASTDGNLRSVAWNGTGPVGASTLLTSAGTGWASRAMFLYQG